MAGWNTDTLAQPAGAGAITIVEGSSFCVSAANYSGTVDATPLFVVVLGRRRGAP